MFRITNKCQKVETKNKNILTKWYILGENNCQIIKIRK